MFGALPPGAWWEVANGAAPVLQPYADRAGEAAVLAAQSGDLELRRVWFAYPTRPETQGTAESMNQGISGLVLKDSTYQMYSVE
jgi:hypothetical protein